MQFPALPIKNPLYTTPEITFLKSTWLEKAFNFYQQDHFSIETISSYLQWTPKYSNEFEELVSDEHVRLILDLIHEKVFGFIFLGAQKNGNLNLNLSEVTLPFMLDLATVFKVKESSTNNASSDYQKYKETITNIFLQKKSLLTDLSDYIESYLYESLNKIINDEKLGFSSKSEILIIDAILSVTNLLEALPESIYSESSSYNQIFLDLLDHCFAMLPEMSHRNQKYVVETGNESSESDRSHWNRK